ncbi:membrane-bound metal-dependent hydrolase [Chloroherpeton thalassium ATCC 35110]|uniref:Membrane-bound metal-dependent hydrolase n=1 Tax=Chloroherpeton thalassium (strain ATCC 35110 / GB-78) TaxID=517418 RepID=B3QWE1_CHLT3|nr:metal-dependent hydrolase [Chloroherpeton thalassium]ACF13254.1 membrane-bound metal-dependent hydrolase [Chloroherpeton thalassium ATCC 35110]
MSSYKGHLFGGALFFIPLSVVLVLFFDYNTLSKFEFLLQVGILFSITLLFSLWPDVDIKSKGQLIFYRFFVGVDVVLILTQKLQESAFLGLFAMLPLIGRHRGWTHSLWAAFLIPTPFLFLPLFYAGKPLYFGMPYYLAALFGYISHRFMDGLVGKKK